MTRARRCSPEHLQTERAHVLAAVQGRSEQGLTSVGAPSGWSIAQLLNHLTHDDEIVWVGAVLGGDPERIALIQDGWKAPVTSGADAVARYRQWSRRSDTVLAHVQWDAPPQWWPPPADAFPFPAFADARSCVLRLLVETATQAGHLDIIREQVDGRQHLVAS